MRPKLFQISRLVSFVTLSPPSRNSRKTETLVKEKVKPKSRRIKISPQSFDLLQESEGEDAVSLCDMPLHHDDVTTAEHSKSSPADQDLDLFQFLNSLDTEMCAAEDVFVRGEIAPFSYRAPNHESKKQSLRSQSLHESRARSRARAMRSSLSVDCRKLERISNSDTPKRPVSGEAKCARSMARVSSRTRPKWYFLGFGFLRTPTGMEMSDIRSRQRRHGPSSLLLPVINGVETVSVDGVTEVSCKRPWKLLRALSCKGNEAIVVG